MAPSAAELSVKENLIKEISNILYKEDALIMI